ncbi:hypothetical protein LZ30DRAFT_703314 [Colletotrichum cereale]|nr:hypothetical protein LZ30DRAFT_703314 [Colletotrichum cereale]
MALGFFFFFPPPGGFRDAVPEGSGWPWRCSGQRKSRKPKPGGRIPIDRDIGLREGLEGTRPGRRRRWSCYGWTLRPPPERLHREKDSTGVREIEMTRTKTPNCQGSNKKTKTKTSHRSRARRGNPGTLSDTVDYLALPRLCSITHPSPGQAVELFVLFSRRSPW